MAPRRVEPTNPSGPAGGSATGTPADTSAVGAGAAIGGQAGVTYPGIPTGVPDEQASRWLQDRINELTNALPQLEQDVDNAGILLDNANQALAEVRANPEPEAEAAAKKAYAEAQRAVQASAKRVRDARAAQNRYLQQQEQVLNRIAKREARNDPQALQEQQLRVQELQAQIKQNEAAQALTEKRLEWEQRKFEDENSPARIKAATDLAAAQTAAQQAATAYDQARAEAYPAESAANVGANEASANANNAQANQIQALIDAGMPEAQAKAMFASANANEAQARASDLAGQVSAEDLRQKQLGELGVYAEQLDGQVKAGVLTRLQAREALQAAVDKATTGATPYERQQQTAANSLAFARDAMQAGTLVNMGQPYATGAEPGGAYSQMSENLGYGPYSQPLNPTPLPKAIANIGADVNAPYTASQLGVPPTNAQAGQQMASGDPRAVQGMGEAAIDWSALTFQQAKALLRGSGGASTPQVPPQTSVPVMHGGGSVPGPMGV
jgi:SWI/SNF-related matrix-associated actin-dependent regulator 1 of chromatin subfamily A